MRGMKSLLAAASELLNDGLFKKSLDTDERIEAEQKGRSHGARERREHALHVWGDAHSSHLTV
jgi:hypothetical protein